jgi:hypothetical protein
MENKKVEDLGAKERKELLIKQYSASTHFLKETEQQIKKERSS